MIGVYHRPLCKTFHCVSPIHSPPPSLIIRMLNHGTTTTAETLPHQFSFYGYRRQKRSGKSGFCRKKEIWANEIHPDSLIALCLYLGWFRPKDPKFRGVQRNRIIDACTVTFLEWFSVGEHVECVVTFLYKRSFRFPTTSRAQPLGAA